MKPIEIQESLGLAQSVLEQWLRYRLFFYKGISDEEISPTDDAEFLEITSSIAQNIRKMGQKIDEKKFPHRNKEIAAQLKSTVSIQGFRNMPEADRKIFYKTWHENMVYLTRTVGAYKFLSEGYRPVEKKTKKKGKGGGFMKVAMIAGGVIVLAILAVAVMNFL